MAGENFTVIAKLREAEEGQVAHLRLKFPALHSL